MKKVQVAVELEGLSVGVIGSSEVSFGQRHVAGSVEDVSQFVVVSVVPGQRRTPVKQFARPLRIPEAVFYFTETVQRSVDA